MSGYLNVLLVLILTSQCYGYLSGVKYFGVQQQKVPTIFPRKQHPYAKQKSRSSLYMVIKGPVRYTATDWLDCLRSLPSSRILKRVRSSVLLMAAWTALLAYIYKVKSFTSSYPPSVHSILGSALGLLLVFRTNTSYDRFWEGRKLWSSIVAKSRDFARDTYIHLDKKHHYNIACLVVAYSISLKLHLQGEDGQEELKPFLCELPNECSVEKLMKYRNRPEYILRQLANLVHIALHERYSNSLEATLHEKDFHSSINGFASIAAGCERIVKQPVPLAYSRHASRFLTFYLFTLPLSLIPVLGYYAVPTMIFIAWSFIGVQEIGHFIEDPFNKQLEILPMQQFISVIRSDISEILDGVISSPEFERLDEEMMRSFKQRARMQDDAFFEYY